MPMEQTHLTIYTCDWCGNVIEVESLTGLTPPWPPGWWGIQPSTPEHDLFCSWRCIASFCNQKADEAEARAEARSSRAAEEA